MSEYAGYRSEPLLEIRYDDPFDDGGLFQVVPVTESPSEQLAAPEAPGENDTDVDFKANLGRVGVIATKDASRYSDARSAAANDIAEY